MVPPAALKKHAPDLPPPAWMRWFPLWHSLAYLLTLGVTILALVGVHTWQTRVLIILSILLWLGWYSGCVRVDPLWWARHTVLTGAYLLVGWVLWIELSQLAAPCTFLLCVLYTQIFLFVALPWKVVLAFALTGLNLGLEILMNGGWYPVFLVFLGISILCIVLALFVSSVIQQSAMQQRLIRELEGKRQELAREERRAGMAEERQRLAYEIHDTLAQGFTSIVMHLEAADAVLSKDVGKARQHLDQARLTACANLAEARRLMWALQPEVLGRAPLYEVLNTLTDQWARESGLAAMATTTGNPRALRPEYEHTLVRATQEALTNVRKHAHASQVTVTLSYMEDLVTLDVQDNGVGFLWGETQRVSERMGHTSGFGLKGLRARVEKLGGTLIIESAPGEGTTIAVALPEPLERSEEEV
jgi:signal transduction histidine kinase